MPNVRSATSSLEVHLEAGWLETDPYSAPQLISSPDPRREKIHDLQDAGKIHYPRELDKIWDPSGAEKIPLSKIQAIDLNRELPPLPKKGNLLGGLRQRTRWSIIGAAAVALAVAVVVGSVSGTLVHRDRRAGISSASNITNTTRWKSSPILENSKMGSLSYRDEMNVTHYRVYFQDRQGILQESAWDSNSTGWTVTDISDPSVDVQLGTPLACACGYPHAMKNYTFVRFVNLSSSMAQPLLRLICRSRASITRAHLACSTRDRRLSMNPEARHGRTTTSVGYTPQRKILIWPHTGNKISSTSTRHSTSCGNSRVRMQD